MRKPLAVIATLLAGTHMAASVMPDTSPEPQAQVIPIQGWGGGGYYGYNNGGGYRYGPGGYTEPSYSGRYYGGRTIPPEGYRTQQRWWWESNQYGRYNNPPWAGRGW